MQRGCLSVENTNGSLLEASLIKAEKDHRLELLLMTWFRQLHTYSL